MTDITVHNFDEKYPEIKCALETSKFISIDLEYSALYPLKNETPRLVQYDKYFLLYIASLRISNLC